MIFILLQGTKAGKSKFLSAIRSFVRSFIQSNSIDIDEPIEFYGWKSRFVSSFSDGIPTNSNELKTKNKWINHQTNDRFTLRLLRTVRKTFIVYFIAKLYCRLYQECYRIANDVKLVVNVLILTIRNIFKNALRHCRYFLVSAWDMQDLIWLFVCFCVVLGKWSVLYILSMHISVIYRLGECVLNQLVRFSSSFPFSISFDWCCMMLLLAFTWSVTFYSVPFICVIRTLSISIYTCVCM